MAIDPDLGVLAIRLVTGATLVAHGVHKLGRGGLAATGRWFASLGLRPPGPSLPVVAAALEVFAGSLFALGLLTPYAAAIVIGLMLVAATVAHRRNGFFIVRNGYEYNLVLVAIAVAVSVNGPGRFSLDRRLKLGDLSYRPVFQLTVSLVLGFGVAAAFLLASYRPGRGGED